MSRAKLKFDNMEGSLRAATSALADVAREAENVKAAIAEERSQLKTENARLRGLAQDVLDALDAEKTPDYGKGHDRAHRAALAMLGKEPIEVTGTSMTLDQIAATRDANTGSGTA